MASCGSLESFTGFLLTEAPLLAIAMERSRAEMVFFWYCTYLLVGRFVGGEDGVDGAQQRGRWQRGVQ